MQLFSLYLVVSLSIALLSRILGDRFDEAMIVPWLVIPILTAILVLKHPSKWPVALGAFASGLIMAQVLLEALGYLPHQIAIEAENPSLTYLLICVLEAICDVFLAWITATLIIKSTNSTKYDLLGNVNDTDISKLINYKTLFIVPTIPTVIYLTRSIEVGIINKLTITPVSAYSLLQSDIISTFMMLPIILGVFLKKAHAPQLQPSLRPFRVFAGIYLSLVLTANLGLTGMNALSTPESVVVVYALLGILSLCSPSMLSAALLQLSVYVSLYISDTEFSGPSVNFATFVFVMGSSTVILMLLRVLSQYRANKNLEQIETQNALLSESAERMRNLAYTDSLTGLMNQMALLEWFSDKAKSIKNDYTVFIVNIDNFRSINETFSHEIGNKLLISISNILRMEFPGPQNIARLGGGEFVVLTEKVDDKIAKEFGISICTKIARAKMLENDMALDQTVSIGCTHASPAQDFSYIKLKCDLALDQARNLGGNTIVIANSDFVKHETERGAFITDHEIQAAIEKFEFSYFCQPIIDFEIDKIVGFETLIRWTKPDGQVISPAVFIDKLTPILFKPHNAKIRYLMREKVLISLAQHDDIYISWNFDLSQFYDLNFIENELQDRNRLLHNFNFKFMYEISEKRLGKSVNEERLCKNIEKLKDERSFIALDDFGVEESNVVRLANLPIDFIKLDKSLVDKIEKDRKAHSIIESLVNLGESLPLQIIAEGMETYLQANLLLECGVKKQQGYYHGKPTLMLPSNS